MYYTKIDSHIAEIILAGDENGLSYLHINSSSGKRQFKIEDEWINNPSFFDETILQLQEYFIGDRKKFTIKLNPSGTPYQKMVWTALQSIPFGVIKTYKDIAIQIGNPKASRAVGMANSKNKIPIIIPCHRVINANGEIGGYGGGLMRKKWLLNHEKEHNKEIATQK